MNCSTGTRFRATRSPRVTRVSNRESVGLLASSAVVATAVCMTGLARLPVIVQVFVAAAQPGQALRDRVARVVAFDSPIR
jgi:hypothetical protein